MIRIRRENEIPMASMSDIAFLLIIFFIISISFVYKQGLQLILPKIGAKPIVVNVKDILILKLDKDGNIYKDEILISINDIEKNKKNAAIIRVDKTCKYKYLVAVIEKLQQNNINKISIKNL